MAKKLKSELTRGKTPPSPWVRPVGPTCDVVHAGGFYFGMGRTASYAAARRHEIPSVRIGGKLRAIVAECERMVGLDSPARGDQAA
jgi:hypothetical protein